MRCQGCLTRFKNKSGLWKHLSQSQRAECKAIYINQINYLPGIGPANVNDTTDTDNADDTDDADGAGGVGDTAGTNYAEDADDAVLPTNTAPTTPTTPNPVNIGADQHGSPPEFDGDFFGNDYSAEDFPGWSEPEGSDGEGSEDGSNSCGGDEEGETGGEGETGDGDMEIVVEGIVEPAPAVTPTTGVTGGSDDGIEVEAAVLPPVVNPGQQAEVEHAQEQMGKVEIVPFGGLAGKPIRTGVATTDCYQTRVHGHTGVANPYAPFNSKTDWEVAKWAKLRGPTSTAVTDLLMIPDVRWSSQYILIVV